jgi:hypothetical protein
MVEAVGIEPTSEDFDDISFSERSYLWLIRLPGCQVTHYLIG